MRVLLDENMPLVERLPLHGVGRCFLKRKMLDYRRWPAGVGEAGRRFCSCVLSGHRPG